MRDFHVTGVQTCAIPISFVAKEGLLKKAKPVSIQIKSKDIIEVLPLLFEGQPFTYQINGRVITLRENRSAPKKEELSHSVKVFQQTLRGTVTDEQGNPLSGVSVVVKGTTTGTSTDQEGRYEIELHRARSVLVFSIIGY